jgi:uncharacterized protein YkwD
MFERLPHPSMALLAGALAVAIVGGLAWSPGRGHAVSHPAQQSVAFSHRDDFSLPERRQAIATPTPELEVAAAQLAPAPAPVKAQPPAPPASGVGGAPGQQFALLNQDRAAAGVPPLSFSSALARVAQYRAEDMLNRNYFSHTDPASGQTAFLQLFRAWGITYSRAGENIAWSSNPSMANINSMWMNSAEHRDNILNIAYHQIGIGVATGGGKTMLVEVFTS